MPRVFPPAPFPRHIKVSGVIYSVEGIIDKAAELAGVIDQLAKLEDWYLRAKMRVDFDYSSQKQELIDKQTELQSL